MSRNVLITGAAARLGLAIADALSAAGWGVIAHANRSAAAAQTWCDRRRQEGHDAWCVTGDLLRPDGPDAVFDAATAAAGHVDALVNNAAVFARQRLETATPADFERAWRVNTLAPVRLSQRLAAHLAARQARGAIVNLLDQRLAHPAPTGALPYLLSKHALEAFTRCAALELAPAVRVNAVAPGAALPPPDAAARELAGPLPLLVRPAPQQVAEAALFLLNAASVTGQTLFVDGGQHLQP